MTWTFESIADWFMPASEQGGSSPYLLRKRVFVFANIIQLLVTVFALFTIALASINYPVDKLSLLLINAVLSSLFVASAKLDLDFERAAFLYVATFLINVTISVCTSGGGSSYMLGWYAVIAVVIGFFLHGWKRGVAFLGLEIVVLVILGLAYSGVEFVDSTSDEYRQVLAVASTLFAVLFCSALGMVNSSLSGSHAQSLADQAHTDPLTGLLNRRGFLLHVEQQQSGSLLMVDVDHFKKINDDYGHDAGDTILLHLAQKMRDTVRDSDKVVRLGGEEFAIWFSRANPSKLSNVVNRIRRAISEPLEIVDTHKNTHRVSVNVSGGLVACKLGEEIGDALARADKLLYQAKASGRNRVVSDAG